MLDTSGSMGGLVYSVGRMYYPQDVGVDSNGNVYVVESRNHRVRKYDSAGNFIKSIGTRRFDTGLHYPQRIHIDANDNFYVSGLYRVQKFNSDGVHKKTFSGLSNTTGIAVDTAGNVYANNTNSIQKWNSSGTQLATLSVSSAYGLDWHGGSVYVTDKNNRRVRKYSDDLSASSLTTFNLSNNTQAGDIEVNSNGIYVASEGYCSKIQKYSLSGLIKSSLAFLVLLEQMDSIIFMVLVQIVLGIYMVEVIIRMQLKNLVLMEYI